MRKFFSTMLSLFLLISSVTAIAGKNSEVPEVKQENVQNVSETTAENVETDYLPEEYNPPLVAGIIFRDKENEVSDDTTTISIDKAGQYTIEANLPSVLKNLLQFVIVVRETDTDNPNHSQIKKHAVRIDEILVNGKPVKFENNATCYIERSSGGKEYGNIEVPIYVPVLYGYPGYTFYYWNHAFNDLKYVIVNPKDFENTETLKITFTYGLF